MRGCLVLQLQEMPFAFLDHKNAPAVVAKQSENPVFLYKSISYHKQLRFLFPVNFFNIG